MSLDLVGKASSIVQGAGAGGEGSAEAIFEKMKADAIKNGWKSAEVKNIQALIRSGSGQ